MNISRDDVTRSDVLVILVLAVVTVYMGASMLDTGWEPETELERYCVDLAANVEANLSAGTPIESCTCIPPGRFNESRYEVSENVTNVTDLFLVQCRFTDGRNWIFPVRKIRPNVSLGNETGPLNGTNTSIIR